MGTRLAAMDSKSGCTLVIGVVEVSFDGFVIGGGDRGRSLGEQGWGRAGLFCGLLSVKVCLDDYIVGV